MRLLIYSVIFLLGASAVSAASEDRTADDDVRLLIVMGGGTYESSVFRFFEMLDGIDFTVANSDTEAFADSLQGRYDAILMYNLSANLDEPGRGHLVRFLESGGGLVVWHHALANYSDWSWWHENVVGARYLMSAEAGHAASTYRQDESYVATPQKVHPVVAALDGHPIHFYGETYRGVWFSDSIDVLLRTGQTGSDGPLIWVGPYESARVIGIQPGHGSSEYYNHGFRWLVRDAIHWVAGKK